MASAPLLRRLSALLISTALLAGCSAGRVPAQTGDRKALSWLGSGSILISGPMPEASSASQRTMLGFLPAEVESRGVWLSLDTARGVLRLMEGLKETLSVRIKEIADVKPGSYELMHKQRDALWHAPEEYFVNRSLSVPPKGDKSRYLRGALGDFVLYISPDLAIHNAPVWTQEIGGIQLNETDIAALYSKCQLGAVVEVE